VTTPIYDNVLLEYQMALALNESTGSFVVPVHIGEYTSDGFLKKFSEDGFDLPAYPRKVDLVL
jgi:hypothetical protein